MLESLQPIYIEYIPHDLEEGYIYISNKYNTAMHLCPCGCKKEVITPFNTKDGWELIQTPTEVTLKPSLFNNRYPCQTHYFITNNKITIA